VPLSVLEEAISVFRANIFSISDRKQIPHLIYQILERELLLEEAEGLKDPTQEKRNTVEQLIGHRDQAELFEVSKRIYGGLQVVLEFMDKGVKGMLSGDLSVLLLQEI